MTTTPTHGRLVPDAIDGLTTLGATNAEQATQLPGSWSRSDLLTAEQRAEILTHCCARPELLGD